MSCIKPQPCRVYIASPSGNIVFHDVDSIKEAAQLVHGVKTYWAIFKVPNGEMCTRKYLTGEITSNLLYSPKFRKSIQDAIRRLK